MTGRKDPSDGPAQRTAGDGSDAGYRAALDAAPNAIVAVDDAGAIVYANPRVLTTFGHEPSELLGRHIELLIPERVHARHRQHRARYLVEHHARPMGIGMDLWGRRRDGSEFPVEISLAPVETADGLRVFATVVDITQRKALEDQLLQGQKMESIGRLAGGIAHDFNNMLSAISGYTELLLDDIVADDVSPDDIRTSVEAIRDAAERATVLTGQLLSFARRQVATPLVVDLNAAIAQLEPMLRRLIGERVTLQMALGGRVGHVRCDPGQLDQIIVNLAVNARDAIEASGTIVIATDEATFDEAYAMEHFAVTPGTYAMLSVSDTGVGMDRETRAHVFEPFFTTKDVGRGTGLGLATIYGIVQQAGGHIWLYSEPGAGTTFKIYLPLIDQPVQTLDRPVDPGQPQFAGRALVVEDEEMVRGLTVRFLRRSGYEVVEAHDGEQALAAIDVGPAFDLVVTDVVMPGMSGTELADRIRERRPNVAVVLVSGYTAETLDIEAQLALGAGFVAKPFSRKQLGNAISVALRSSGHGGGPPPVTNADHW